MVGHKVKIQSQQTPFLSGAIVAGDMICFVVKGVLHPTLVFGLFLHFSQKLQHIGNK